ncbi:MAG: uroporphyrinogen III synthase [Candidatus Pelagibacter sp.]|nr:uroporphyrinogen III synthase [Candidatus Pelagibacter sp.]
MHILLTRPLEDSKSLILRFTTLGNKVSHLPVIKVFPIKYDEPEYNDYKGIIFTSANAIKNLNIKRIDKKIQCFCVGTSTEKVAKQSGFQNIFCAEGNVNNLKEIILQNFDKKKGSLIYVSGEIVSYNLDQYLSEAGYSIKRIITYKVKHNDDLKEEFINALKSNIPDIVFIYSENSARSLLNILKKYELKDLWMETNLMCLGEGASSVLNEIKWKKIFLFNSGEEEFLLYKI